jgi:Ca2+:H+ antiporter
MRNSNIQNRFAGYTRIMYQRLLLILIPLSFVLHAIDADPRIVFVVSLSAIVPLVEVMGIATERLSKRLGSVIGGLLNSTLSNAPELIIGIVALRNGLGRIVKASLTGSIMVNLLVGLGCALVVGGLKYGVHSFDRRSFDRQV